AREPDVGYVHEGIDTRARLRRDVAAERSKVVGTGIPRRHAGGRALIRDQFVGRNADGRAIGIDVRVEVDEPRRHELAAGVEHTRCARSAGISASSASITPNAPRASGLPKYPPAPPRRDAPQRPRAARINVRFAPKRPRCCVAAKRRYVPAADICSAAKTSLDHLVSNLLKMHRDIKSKGLSHPEIDKKLETG